MVSFWSFIFFDSTTNQIKTTKMKTICIVAFAFVGLVAGDVSHLSGHGYDYTPPAPPAPAPAPAPQYLPPTEEIVKPEAIAAPAPEYLPPAEPAAEPIVVPEQEVVAPPLPPAPAPAPAPEYLPPAQEEVAASAPVEPAPEYLPPAPAAEEIEPEAAHELHDDGYHYKTVKQYRFRTRF